MQTRLGILLALAFSMLMFSRPVRADEAPAKLVMGVSPYTPSSMKGADGQWTGTCADAWKRVAEELSLKFEWKEVDPKEVMAKGLEANGVDGVICVVPSPRTEKVMDVTKPYSIAGLAIATRPESQSGVSRVLDKVLSWKFLRNLGILILIVIVAGIVVWRVERKAMPDDFGGSALKGIGNGAFWSVEALFSKARPLSKSLRSRVVALFWIIASIMLISGVTASLSAEFTVNKLTGQVSGAKDLPNVRVGASMSSTGAKSSGARYLDSKGIASKTYSETPKTTGVEGALAALDRGEIDAVVANSIELQYLANHNFPGKLLVLPETIQPNVTGFGLKPNHPRRKEIDLAILRLFENGVFKQIASQYLGGTPD
jgi:ABC-type amino acid transport substrate-binding protein